MNKPYNLSDDQIDSFDRNGYLILRNWIPAELVARLQRASDEWIARGRAESPDDPDLADFAYATRPSGRQLYRVNYLHNKQPAASLELLGSPAMLGIAESLAGPDFVPTYEALVFKNAGEGAPVEWHQDAVHPRSGRIFNVGVYLDSARSAGGAVRVVPGTHKAPADVCALDEKYGWEVPGAVAAELEPGDVLVHDVMVVHGSPGVSGNPLRRTIYYEFRPIGQILEEGPWDLEWMQRRLRLIPAAQRAHDSAFPDAAPFQWNVAEGYRPEDIGGKVEVRILHTSHSPGAYCTAGSVTPTKVRR